MDPSIDRRVFLSAAAALAGAAIAPSLSAHDRIVQTAPHAPASPTAPAAAGPFTLPALPYEPDALEPVIDTETMRLHHGKHHQAYVTNLNNAVRGIEVPASVEELIAKLDSLPADKITAIRNNGGGHANHSLFWSVLAPKGQGGEPSPALRAAIDRDLGGLEKLKELLSAGALARFGSGWSWLVVGPDGRLLVTSTANQDSPLMGQPYADKPGTPIFGIDVWEHAYYLKYQNRRPEYVQAMFDIINWNEVSRRFDAATR